MDDLKLMRKLTNKIEIKGGDLRVGDVGNLVNLDGDGGAKSGRKETKTNTNPPTPNPSSFQK